MVLRKYWFFSIIFGFSSVFFFVTPSFAHVIVTPHQIGIAATQDFTLSVPNEKDDPVVSVRLLIPKGLNDVIPNATPGWSIATKESGSGSNAEVTEIDWSDGSIPVGQRQEFVFQGQAPAQLTTLAWKAYQTYTDGTVVSWDINPKTVENMSDVQQDHMADKENKGEYSTTQVINDLAASNAVSDSISSAVQSAQLAELFAGLAVILSVVALYLAWKKNK